MCKEGVHRGSEAACKVALLDGVSAGAVPIRGRHGCLPETTLYKALRLGIRGSRRPISAELLIPKPAF